ncbi:type 4a pilus biogenesis protein PilO [Candidatus Wolfebacteria bacterium]|nr:type 4a pilus biogenesis protein PilO [Candidatus Wolfebacteria bacterium]
MKYSSKRFLSIIIAVAFFVGAVLAYQNFVSPAYDEVKQIQGELAEKKKITGEYQGIFDQIQQLYSNYQNYGDLQKNVSLALPSDPAVAESVFQITKLASVNNLSVQSLDVKKLALIPSKSTVIKSLGTLRFSIRLTGGYESLKSYLQGLESNIRLMNVNSLKIEKVGAASNLFNYNLEADAYYQSQ